MNCAGERPGESALDIASICFLWALVTCARHGDRKVSRWGHGERHKAPGSAGSVHSALSTPDDAVHGRWASEDSQYWDGDALQSR